MLARDTQAKLALILRQIL